MQALAPIFGVLGVIGFFFYYIIGNSQQGADGQGVNMDVIAPDSLEGCCAKDQKGRWD
tara:strand:- start:403 stop:576 length:174 start_codon:yes stop_codon:yes gene_type:complete